MPVIKSDFGIPSQDLLCEHIQVPQLSPSPLHSHKPASQQRHGQGVCGINFVSRVQLRLPYFMESLPVLCNHIVLHLLVVHDEQLFDAKIPIGISVGYALNAIIRGGARVFRPR